MDREPERAPRARERERERERGNVYRINIPCQRQSANNVPADAENEDACADPVLLGAPRANCCARSTSVLKIYIHLKKARNEIYKMVIILL
jgi:hypothetical protein